jgi:Ca2+-binding RTX toxin-like protein
MAVFDAANADEDIRFVYGSDLIDFSSEVQATSLLYEWRTSGGNSVTAYGDFTYDVSGELIGGVVSSIDINLSDDSDVDVSITSIDNADILTLLQDHQSFWREVFIGDDQFLLPTGQTSFFVGDVPASPSGTSVLNAFDGGDDSFDLTLSGNSSAFLRGDFESFRSIETISAGVDHFVIDGATSATSAIMGDAANIREGTLHGGDDIIDTGGVTSGRFILYGDVATIENGSLVGGHDTIIGGDGDVTVHGDGSIISGGLVYSVVIGGNDDIQTGSGADSINGDAESLTRGSLTGGNDFIHAGDGQDHIYGDIASISSDSSSNEVFIAGDDTIYGGDGGDWIRGDIGAIQFGAGISASNITFGNDILFGGDGDDEIYGDIEDDFAGRINSQMGGDDLIDGGNGDDYMDAGGHVNGDSAAFTSAESGVVVSLALQGAAQDTVGAGLDTLIGFENLIGSRFGDTLIGDSNNNVIMGGEGNDVIDGGDGVDTAQLVGDQSAFSFVDIEDGLVQVTGTNGEVDILESIEFVQFDNGTFALEDLVVDISTSPTDGDDVITGTVDADDISALGGNDTVSGGDGNDMLSGDDGNDILNGGADNDILIGGAGSDTLNGGDGVDTASYASATGRVTVDLQNSAINFGDAVGDTFSNIEVFEGSNRNDQLRGDSGDNTFFGGVFSDRLYGRAGDDNLNGEGGADAIYGNSGVDTMTGGDDTLRDRFIYFNSSESGVGAGNRDIITDFTSSEDRIEISRFDANSIAGGGNDVFVFVEDAAFSSTAGELRFEQDLANAITVVQADFDGDGAADFEIELTGLVDLESTDFLL